MSIAAHIDALFTSGYTLATSTASAPCDFYDADAVDVGDGGYGGTLLNRKTVLVRTSAFPDLDDEDEVIVSDEDNNELHFKVQGRPRRIQDGRVMEVALQTFEA